MNGTDKLTDTEVKFILAEFETAWKMVLAIDERRFVIIRFYSLLFAAIMSVVATILVTNGEHNYKGLSLACVGVLFTGVIIGILVIYMLRSERRANIRYRKKINFIRELLLAESSNSNIVKYLKEKSIGIKLYSSDPQPKGLGSTLSKVIPIICIEIALLLAAIIFIFCVVYPYQP